jgi:cardiolipin synthase
MRGALLLRDNLAHRHDIEYAYLDAIRGARREILIANAYFLPGRRFRKALLLAAQRGVKVSLLLQGRSDHVLFHYATQALYDRMLAAGVRVYEYDQAELHAKVAVVDDDWATVGSSNIDPFSLLLAREANLVVRDAGFAAELRASLTAALDGAAREVRVEDQRRRPWHARLASVLAYSAGALHARRHALCRQAVFRLRTGRGGHWGRSTSRFAAATIRSHAGVV